MIYQSKFELTDENADYFGTQFDILILGSSDLTNERNVYVRNKLKNFNGILMCLNVCDEGKTLSYIIFNSQHALVEEASGLLLMKDLVLLLRRYNKDQKKICIDITTLNQILIFYLTKLILIEIRPAELFAAYTEPLEYKKKITNDIGNLFEYDEYDLFSKLGGSSFPVPGFARSADRKKPYLLVSSMGFETQRLSAIYDSLKPSEFIPIIGFPSFVPGWNLTAVKMNWLVLKTSDAYDNIKKCEASSPFAFYELLLTIYNQHIEKYNVYIAPLGTRPHCLGSAIFASKFNNVYLIYDFPVEKLNRSNKINKAHIYHLSKYIN